MSSSPDSRPQEQVLVPPQELQDLFVQVLSKHHFVREKATTLARVFMENSLDGVYSHGVNRFPRFIEYVKKGFVNIDKEPVIHGKAGAIEQWNGQLGPGILNALKCTERAMELARNFGLGCVALSNTNHWMRGGTYGWKAAKEGFVFIGWTNTTANMPAWGAINSKLGNNPLVMAIPYQEEAIVLDMAMSQYSYGSLESKKLNGGSMPFPAGYNQSGQLTADPSEVLESGRILPAGYWKGAGLSLLLDVLSTILSAGLSVSEISKREFEYGVSQVFIAIDVSKLSNYNSIQQIVSGIIEDYHASVPGSKNGNVRYPGEGSLNHRQKNRKEGIPVNKEVWEEIKSL